MRLNISTRFLSLTLFGMLLLTIILASCQLLRPYKGPITPTPDQWKRTYDAPDAGQPTIPRTWKDGSTHLSSQSPEPIQGEVSNPTSETAENISQENAFSNLETSSEPQEPSFEDVCRDLSNWWEFFHDPVLNQLEEQALNSSYTLWAALERVIQARALARVNFAPLLPAVNFNPSFTRSGQLIQNNFTQFANAQQGTTAATDVSISDGAKQAIAANQRQANIPNVFRVVQTQYLVPLDLTYEIDLWSQLTNTYYAALIRAQAASQAYLSVLLSLTADVAAAYFQLRGLDAQQEVLEQNILVRQHALEITRARFNAGLIVYLDVSRAEVEFARAHSDLDNVQRLRGLQENLLATLVGIPASVFSVKYDPVIIPPPVVPTGIPSELLCRRPDIAEAERNLAAAYRDIGVAYANFFPSLTLNASLGSSSPFACKLFTWQSRFWQVGWNIMQTVFDAGKNQANYDYYRSIFCEAMANYQQVVLQAFQDVEDSLVDLRQYARQAQDLAIAVRAARTTLELAQMRYDRGLVNYLDVVDAERQLLETEQNSVIILGNRYVSTVRLIRALGGGWGPCSDFYSDEVESNECY